MRLRTRVLIIITASLVGLVVMGFFGLYTMRQSMMKERREQVSTLLDLANAQLRYFHSLELSGKLTRSEAQARAKESIATLQTKDDYFIVRNVEDNMLLVHATTSRVGKIDPGGKTLDDRPVIDVYKEEIGKSKDGKGYVLLAAVRPNSGNDKLHKKLNGATIFAPWGWIVAIGFFVDDIDARFWRQSWLFILVGGTLLAVLAALVLRMRAVILRQLGGEPHDAAESMRRIASGDLAVEIVVQKDDKSSLMASLKLMQMKLKNITAAIHEDAATLTDQIQRFDEMALSYAETKSEEALAALLRAVTRLGKTASILHESIARFKL